MRAAPLEQLTAEHRLVRRPRVAVHVAAIAYEERSLKQLGGRPLDV